MRLLVLFLFALLVFGTVGCGHVAGNYPIEKVQAEKKLPETFEHQGKSRQLVWRDEGEIHGFVGKSKTCADMVKMMRGYAKQGHTLAERDAKIFEPMARSGLAFTPMRVFVARGVQRRIERGDFLITFADGTSAPDKGALLYPIMGDAGAPSSSLGAVVRLEHDGDPDLKGRALYLFFPEEFLDRTIRSVEFVDAVAVK
jgi:hypothetical protein